MSRRLKPGRGVRLRIDVSVILPKPIDSVIFLGSPKIIMGELQLALAQAIYNLLPEEYRNADETVSLLGASVKLSVDRRPS